MYCFSFFYFIQTKIQIVVQSKQPVRYMFQKKQQEKNLKGETSLAIDHQLVQFLRVPANAYLLAILLTAGQGPRGFDKQCHGRGATKGWRGRERERSAAALEIERPAPLQAVPSIVKKSHTLQQPAVLPRILIML